MKNLKDFTVHEWHDVPTMEIYDYEESAWIVYEQCTNYPIVHYVHAWKEDEALNKVYTFIEESDDYKPWDTILVSAEMILLTDEDIEEWFRKINHD